MTKCYKYNLKTYSYLKNNYKSWQLIVLKKLGYTRVNLIWFRRYEFEGESF